MAISRILHMKSHHKSKGSHLQVAINYILNDSKTRDGYLTGAVNCDIDHAYEDMLHTKQFFGKTDKRQGYHIIISFEEGECSADIALNVIREFVEEYLAEGYETVYAVHDNTNHVHGHIIWNSVRFTDGYKYRYEKGDWERTIQPNLNKICEKYGLSTLDPTIRATTKEWDQNTQGTFRWNDMIKRDVDACIITSSDFNAWISNMKDLGYEIKCGKYLAVRPPGMERFRRLKTLGQGYSELEIRYKIENSSLTTYSKGKDKKPKIIGYKYVRKGSVKPRKLTGLKKQYVAMLFRLGKIKKKSYSSSYMYRDDLKRFAKIKKLYLFVNKYDIESKEEIASIQEQLNNKVKILKSAKKVLEEQIKEYSSVFSAVDVIDEHKKAAVFSKLGEDLEEESTEVGKSFKCLQDNNITLQKAKEVKEHYLKLLDENKLQLKKMRSDIRVSKQVVQEVERLEMERERRKETNLNKNEKVLKLERKDVTR